MSTRMPRQIARAALILLTAVIAASASAANFQIIGSNGRAGTPGCGTDPGFSLISTSSLDASFGDGSIGCLASGRASASQGGVGVQATLTASPPDSSSRAIGASATASFDVDITLPSNYTGELIQVSVNASIDGQISSVLSTTSVLSRLAEASLTGTVTISGRSSPLTFVSDSISSTHRVQTTSNETAGGESILSGLTTPTITIDPRFPLTVQLQLTGGAEVVPAGDSTATASVDALNTLSFATAGDVFNLPAGFSVTSAEAGILDNRFVVPEPSVLSLLVPGLAVLGARRPARRAASCLRRR